MKILIVEDEPELAASIREFLEKEHYLVETAENFRAGIGKATVFEYDCILLDITLPGGSGMEILKSVKEIGMKSNVIIISAKDSLDDKIDGLALGADDYLTKPFHLAELNARIKAVLRRNNQGGTETLTFHNVTLDIKDRQLTVGSEKIPLFRKEFDILYVFMVNKERLLTKSAIAEHVWGDHYEDADNLDFVYYQIKNLRKKLTVADADIEITSSYGVGYTMKSK